jgi:hypothetical protein
MRGGFLHVSYRHAGIQRGGDERVPPCQSHRMVPQASD